jgi:hypothetical protein
MVTIYTGVRVPFPAVAPTTNGYYLHWCSSTLSCCSTYNKWLLSSVVFENLHPAVAPTTNGYCSLPQRWIQEIKRMYPIILAHGLFIT